MRRAHAALVACALLLAGCTYHVRQIGDDHFLGDPPAWQIGMTTVRDVVRDFGPPDAVRWTPKELVFVYRAQRRANTSLVLSFYLKLFSDEQRREEDATLVAGFDGDDRLLYYGVSEEPRHDLRGDLGL
jgi:hypothetical protein